MSSPELAVALLTREYPPDVYGGAGVHVEYLARELARLVDVTVHALGRSARRLAPASRAVVAHEPWAELAGPAPPLAALRAVSVDLRMAATLAEANVVHSHTWYANLGGHLGGLVHGIPHVATVHSLEPMRPWKAEQLGGGYAVSCFCERTGLEGADAIIAVSEAMRRDVLDCYPAIDPERVVVIGNGIDTGQFRPVPAPTASAGSGSTWRRRSSSSSAASPARRASPTCSTPPSTSTRRPSSSSAPARPTPPSSGPRSR